MNLYNTPPIIAIANYGPHSSLEDSIRGIKTSFKEKGYIEGKDIIFKISNVNFDTSLIPQMISSLEANNPKVIIAMTTPIAQYSKGHIKDIPVIFNVITDPVEAGLLSEADKKENNFTFSSDRQDLELLLKFAINILPQAKHVGMLYSTSEANDQALFNMMREAANKTNLELVSIAIDHPRDIPIRMQAFKDKVDFIYVGTSGPIQPALPIIIAEADKMMIPVFNVNEEAVQNNQALASFGVDYFQMGKSTGEMAITIIKEGNIPDPIYPNSKDFQGFISKKKAEYFGISLPVNLQNTTILD
jgi:putative tryptophan/tyrosine transport system substrate-binding protein